MAEAGVDKAFQWASGAAREWEGRNNGRDRDKRDKLQVVSTLVSICLSPINAPPLGTTVLLSLGQVNPVVRRPFKLDRPTND